LSSDVFSPGTAALEDEPESLVVDSLPDEAQAESSNAITKTRRPDRTARLITATNVSVDIPDASRRVRHPGHSYADKHRGATTMPSRLISTATAPMCSALVKLTGLVGWTLLRRVFSRRRSFSDDSLLLG
jgi:hypothetical protein